MLRYFVIASYQFVKPLHMNKNPFLDHESYKMLSTVTRKLKSQACLSKTKIDKMLLHLALLAAFVLSLLHDDALY